MATRDPARTRRVGKIVGFDAGGNKTAEWQSKQLLEDPFAEVPGYGLQIRIPPYSMEQMVILAEQMPVHASCIDQKVLDIIGDGPVWRQDDLSSDPNKGQGTRILSWWNSLSDEFTMLEILQSMWSDFEVTGWGILEVGRDASGVVRQLYPVPAHTIRAHAEGTLFAQIRHGRVVWFKRWGTAGCFSSSTGRPCDPSVPQAKQANELLIFRKPSRRSTWYSIPGYISAVGYMSLSIAARDWNIQFFDNSREVRHMIFLTGLEEDIDRALDDLETSMKTQGNEPHRNIIVPLSGDVKVTIEKLASIPRDMDYVKLTEQAEHEVLLAHRLPPDRLGIAHVNGLMGGSTSALVQTINTIYKAGIVVKGQHLAEDRLDRFVAVEYEKATHEAVTYHSDLEEVDISDAAADADVVVNLVKNGVLELNEGRARLGYEPRKEFKDYTLPEYLKVIGVSSAAHTGIQFLSPALLNPDGTISADQTNQHVVSPDGKVQGTSNVQDGGFPIEAPPAAKQPELSPTVQKFVQEISEKVEIMDAELHELLTR